MFSNDQVAAVSKAFALLGYDGPLRTAPVTTEDETVFVLPPDAYGLMSDRRILEQYLQGRLQQKACIVEQSASWSITEPFR